MIDVAVPTAVDQGVAASSRLSLPVRITLLVLALLALLFCAGMVVGIAVAMFEDGALTPGRGASLGAALLGVGGFAWACRRLSAPWRQAGRSAYERRYAKMMALLFASGLPIGLLIGLAGHGQPQDSLFSNGPLDPRLAGVAAASVVMVLAATLVLYHRTIDDHEQQAYLWANSIAFYFVAIAMPAAWLLSRGGLIAPIGIGGAMLILLAALVINFTVWAWLKFR